ncbi:MAG: hypothetical protein DRI24_02215 [Deltaproteobacteria bacterium]|nr:MAG: hypothetical protein DRI24_02215 [Deltaproteobacteria bacterium]
MPPTVILEKEKCAVAFNPASRVCVHLSFGHLQIKKRDCAEINNGIFREALLHKKRPGFAAPFFMGGTKFYSSWHSSDAFLAST